MITLFHITNPSVSASIDRKLSLVWQCHLRIRTRLAVQTLPASFSFPIGLLGNPVRTATHFRVDTKKSANRVASSDALSNNTTAVYLAFEPYRAQSCFRLSSTTAVVVLVVLVKFVESSNKCCIRLSIASSHPSSTASSLRTPSFDVACAPKTV